MKSLCAGSRRPWGPWVWNPSRPHRAWIIRRMSSRSLPPTRRRSEGWRGSLAIIAASHRARRAPDRSPAVPCVARTSYGDSTPTTCKVAVPSDRAYGWVFHRCDNPNANAIEAVLGSRSTGTSGLAAAMKGRWTVSQTAALAPFEVQRPPEPLASGQKPGFRGAFAWWRTRSARPGCVLFSCSLVCRTKGNGQR